MTDDLDRVLADIDTLLPPGAPTNPHHDGTGAENWEREAMRWSPVDHDDHPDTTAAPEPGNRDYRPRAVSSAQWMAPALAADRHRRSLGLFQQQRPLNLWPDIVRVPPVGSAGVPDRVGVLIEQAARYSGWSESVMRAAIQATADAYQAQLESLTAQAQHTTSNLQHLRNRHRQAQQVIEARRHRNTGPQNPAGIDGRPRRHKHPTRAPARNATPATHEAATQVILAWQDGTLTVGFDGAWDVGL